jgi:tetratricopeptide (TPR) repeat protein
MHHNRMSARDDFPKPPATPAPVPAERLREALHCLRIGESGRAEAMAHESLASAPDDPAWLTILAVALSTNGRPSDALPLYERLVALQPGQARHWSNLGNCLCELRREREAAEPLQRALALGADDAAVHFAMARAHSANNEPRHGLTHIEKALSQAPGDIEFHLLHARLLGEVDAWEATKHKVDLLRQQPLDAAQQVELGYLLLRGSEHAQALQLFESVLAEHPDEHDARIGAILALERLNRLDAAQQQRAILTARLDVHAPARLHDKLLQVDARLAARVGDHAQAREKLQQLLALPEFDTATQISFGFDLGAALVKLGEPDAAMAAFARAHALRRAQVNAQFVNLRHGEGLYDVIDEPLPDPAPAGLDFDDGHIDPVFVVGFPRSGTTLLEQLLDAHPGLVSFDEQPFVQQLAQTLYTRGDSIRIALQGLDRDDRLRLRRDYFSDVATVIANSDALPHRRPVDKNPLNLLRLPMLPHLFPRAQAVLVIRHPCDVVLSCYMQHFGSPAFAVTFETLESCAEMYDRVFGHWLRMRDGLSLPVHLLRYEDLVADTEAEARRLFAFLDLPWHADLLRFTERARDRVIGTPSYAQVIEPVNRKAVGRWTAFRDHFNARALALLGPWVERFGYPPL